MQQFSLGESEVESWLPSFNSFILKPSVYWAPFMYPITSIQKRPLRQAKNRREQTEVGGGGVRGGLEETAPRSKEWIRTKCVELSAWRGPQADKQLS